MKMFALRHYYFTDGWCIFDFVVVCLSLFRSCLSVVLIKRKNLDRKKTPRLFGHCLFEFGGEGVTKRLPRWFEALFLPIFLDNTGRITTSLGLKWCFCTKQVK